VHDNAKRGIDLKICIVGGGGGASNAANVIRSLDARAEIDIFTNRSEIGNLPCEIPFVLDGSLPSWQSSFAFGDKFYKERGVGVHLDTEVTELIPREKRLIAGGEGYSYDKAILDLGAVPITPSVPGLNGRNEFVLSAGLKHAKLLQEAIPKCSSAAIIGTGQIALEMATVLKGKAYEHVYLIGRSEHILRAYVDGDLAGLAEERITKAGMELILSAEIIRVADKGHGKLLSLSGRELDVGFVFFATGAKPNTGLAGRAGIKLGETGAIAVNEHLQTSDPDIYAIGDCMENWERIKGKKIRYQTAANAARTGRIAGRNLVLGNTVRYPGTVMPFVTESFGHQIGAVGLTEAQAKDMGLDVSSITTTSTRRRLFGGKPIHIKLVADRATGTLLGAQILSEELVAGKIDRLAVAIAERIPIQRLSLIPTCYSPTTGAGYEAVTMALDALEEKLGS
jgi:NADPH-dependent 2,4-dienoyl-CoA reductase/sulfur reductase-like enzyme